MNTQIESGLRVTLSAMLAALLTSIVVGGIGIGSGSGSGSAAARAAAVEVQLVRQVTPALFAPAAQTDAPARAA